jgi:uncharacterized membrane protein YbaN (DUF454 family)
MTVRLLLVGAGTGFVGLGVVGIVVPGLPTTPFLLLAAACYARSSNRFYQWLVSNRIFGPSIRQWRETHSIPRKSKYWALGFTLLSFGATIIFFAPSLWVRVVLIVMLSVLLYLIWRLPTRDDIHC